MNEEARQPTEGQSGRCPRCGYTVNSTCPNQKWHEEHRINFVAAHPAEPSAPPQPSIPSAEPRCNAYIGGPPDSSCILPKGHRGNCHAISAENMTDAEFAKAMSAEPATMTAEQFAPEFAERLGPALGKYFIQVTGPTAYRFAEVFSAEQNAALTKRAEDLETQLHDQLEAAFQENAALMRKIADLEKELASANSGWMMSRSLNAQVAKKCDELRVERDKAEREVADLRAQLGDKK